MAFCRTVWLCYLAATFGAYLKQSLAQLDQSISLNEGSAQSPPILEPGASPERKVPIGTQNYILKCPVSSESPLLVEWRKNGETIGAGWKRLRVQPDGELKLKLIKEEDQGNYECRAANGFGSLEFTYRLEIVDKTAMNAVDGGLRDSVPYWKEVAYIQNMATHGPTRHMPGTSTRLRCVAGGYPQPDIAWYKDGRLIEKTWAGNWFLELSDLLPSDSGTYMCKVSNIFGQKNTTFQLEIPQPLVTVGKPKFLNGLPKNTSVSEGEEALLGCLLYSPSKPRIQWLQRVDQSPSTKRTAREQMIEIEGHRYRFLENYPNKTDPTGNNTWYSWFAITGTKTGHTGWYMCAVASEAAADTDYRIAYLTVSKQNSMTVILASVIGIAFILVLLVVLCLVAKRRGACLSASSTQPASRTPTHPANSLADSKSSRASPQLYSQVPTQHGGVMQMGRGMGGQTSMMHHQIRNGGMGMGDGSGGSGGGGDYRFGGGPNIATNNHNNMHLHHNGVSVPNGGSQLPGQYMHGRMDMPPPPQFCVPPSIASYDHRSPYYPSNADPSVTVPLNPPTLASDYSDENNYEATTPLPSSVSGRGAGGGGSRNSELSIANQRLLQQQPPVTAPLMTETYYNVDSNGVCAGSLMAPPPSHQSYHTTPNHSSSCSSGNNSRNAGQQVYPGLHSRNASLTNGTVSRGSQ